MTNVIGKKEKALNFLMKTVRTACEDRGKKFKIEACAVIPKRAKESLKGNIELSDVTRKCSKNTVRNTKMFKKQSKYCEEMKENVTNVFKKLSFEI